MSLTTTFLVLTKFQVVESFSLYPFDLSLIGMWKVSGLPNELFVKPVSAILNESVCYYLVKPIAILLLWCHYCIDDDQRLEVSTGNLLCIQENWWNFFILCIQLIVIVNAKQKVMLQRSQNFSLI